MCCPSTIVSFPSMLSLFAIGSNMFSLISGILVVVSALSLLLTKIAEKGICD